jgi:general secretion pathway protein M
MNLPGLLNQSGQSLSEFWTARDARERKMLTAAVLVATLGLTYALLIDPALSGRAQLNKSLPVLRQQVAQMQALSKEAAELSGKAPSPVMAMSKGIIEASLARNGLKQQNIVLSGDFAKVQLNSVSFAGMLNWLDDMQHSSRLAVIDANIIALAQPGMVDATFTLRQQRSE